MQFDLLGDKIQPKATWTCGNKSNCPISLIAGFSTLGNCNQFAITDTRLSHHCEGILDNYSLQNCFKSATLEFFEPWA